MSTEQVMSIEKQIVPVGPFRRYVESAAFVIDIIVHYEYVFPLYT